MTPAVREGLTNALIKNDATGDLLYRNKPYQPKTPWSISGILARITLAVQNRFKPKPMFVSDEEEADPAARLTQTHYEVKGSGAVGLVIALLIVLFVGMSGILRPVETGLQIGRDAARRHAASGDIVVIAKDDRSAKIFGSLPWPRRYDAQLVDKLRAMGAKRIVFNQIMADSFNRADDEALAAAFDRAGGGRCGLRSAKNMIALQENLSRSCPSKCCAIEASKPIFGLVLVFLVQSSESQTA